MSAQRTSRLIMAALLLGAAAVSPAREVGESAPAFANPDLTGRYVTHKKVIGGSWVIIDFFATWCEPCKKELPELEALAREFSKAGVKVIVFATDKDKNKPKEFFSQRPTNLTVLLDPYQMAYLRYNKEDDGLPTTFLIDPDGKIALKNAGYDEQFIQKMRETIAGGSGASGASGDKRKDDAGQ